MLRTCAITYPLSGLKNSYTDTYIAKLVSNRYVLFRPNLRRRVYKFDVCCISSRIFVKKIIHLKKKMKKKEFRMLYRHYFLAKNTVETKTWFEIHYSDSTPENLTV